jgi:hypothetical protein
MPGAGRLSAGAGRRGGPAPGGCRRASIRFTYGVHRHVAALTLDLPHLPRRRGRPIGAGARAV